MVLLVEGQRPIFGRKLRFHEHALFNAAAQFAKENQPAVPEADFITVLQVPAVGEAYAGVSPAARADQGENSHEATDAKEPIAVASALRLARATTRPNTQGSAVTNEPDEVTDRAIATIAARLKPTAEHLRETIDAKLTQAFSARSRISIQEILNQTVPDPAGVGLTWESEGE